MDIETIYMKFQDQMDTRGPVNVIKEELNKLFCETVISLDPEGYDKLPEDLQNDLYQKFVDMIILNV